MMALTWCLYIAATSVQASVLVGGKSDTSAAKRQHSEQTVKELYKSLETKKNTLITNYTQKVQSLRSELEALKASSCGADQKLHWEGNRWICLDDQGCEPRDCILTTNPRPQTELYAWHVDAWSTCNNGMQQRIVRCNSADSGIVNDSFCTSYGEKPDSEKSCGEVASTVCQGKTFSSGKNGYCHMANSSTTGSKSGSCSASSSQITGSMSSDSSCSYICASNGNWLISKNNCQPAQ